MEEVVDNDDSAVTEKVDRSGASNKNAERVVDNINIAIGEGETNKNTNGHLEEKEENNKPKKGHRPSLNRGPLTEKEECPDCKKVLSKHSLIYNTHKCAAKARKNIVVENIEDSSTDLNHSSKASPLKDPVGKAPPPTKRQHLEETQQKLPKNYIDLDGDIGYGHLNVHNIINGYVRFTQNKEKEYKQQNQKGTQT